jgi:hypothetical protein
LGLTPTISLVLTPTISLGLTPTISLGLTPTIYNDRGDQANRFTLYFDVCLLDLL